MEDVVTELGEAEPWLTELQKEHSKLWKHHPIHLSCCADREPPRQLNDEDIRACLDEAMNSDDYRSRKEIIEEHLVEVYSDYLSRTCDGDEIYQVQIKKLLSAFQYDIPSRIVADAVGCSTGHARRYRWDNDQQAVREKRWSEKQREHQAPPKLVSQIRDRDDDSCVRCESTNQTVVHHIDPVGKDGPAVMQNLAVLCKRCHTEAHDGTVNKGDVIHESVEQFWSWANGYRRWEAENSRQITLDDF